MGQIIVGIILFLVCNAALLIISILFLTLKSWLIGSVLLTLICSADLLCVGVLFDNRKPRTNGVVEKLTHQERHVFKSRKGSILSAPFFVMMFVGSLCCIVYPIYDMINEWVFGAGGIIKDLYLSRDSKSGPALFIFVFIAPTFGVAGILFTTNLFIDILRTVQGKMLLTIDENGIRSNDKIAKLDFGWNDIKQITPRKGDIAIYGTGKILMDQSKKDLTPEGWGGRIIHPHVWGVSVPVLAEILEAHRAEALQRGRS